MTEGPPSGAGLRRRRAIAAPVGRRSAWAEPVRAVTAMAVLVGLALHVWLLISPLHVVDSDEAVSGLMARAFLHGHWSAFFWGQHYGSAHEPLLIALLLRLGVPLAVAMKAVPLAFFTGSAVLVWRIARRVAGEGPGRLAGALLWAAPAGLVWMSLKERGFYGATLFFGLAAVLAAFRLLESGSWKDAALLGLAAGSAFYASPQSQYLVAPLLVWLAVLAVRRFGWRTATARGGIAAAGVVAGGLPWLWANAGRGWPSLDVPADLPSTTFADRLHLFAVRGVPAMLGFRDPVSPAWLGGVAGKVGYVAAVAAALVFLAVALRRGGPQRAGLALVATGLLAYPLLFALLRTSFYVGDPRYLTFLPPFVFVLVGCVVARARRVGLGLALAVLALSVVGTATLVRDGPAPGRWDISALSLGPLREVLERHGIDRVYADYWLAYRLTLDTKERVVASPFTSIRHIGFEREVRCSPRPAFAAYRGTREGAALERYFATQAPARRFVAGPYEVFQPSGKVLPEDVSAEWNTERIVKLVEPHADELAC